MGHAHIKTLSNIYYKLLIENSNIGYYMYYKRYFTKVIVIPNTKTSNSNNCST